MGPFFIGTVNGANIVILSGAQHRIGTEEVAFLQSMRLRCAAPTATTVRENC